MYKLCKEILDELEAEGVNINHTYRFPEPIKLEKRLKDILEPSVDESFYLSDEQVAKIRVWENRQIENGRGFRFNVHSENDIATTNTTSADRPSTSNYVMRVGGLYDKEGSKHQAGSIYEPSGIAATLSTMQGGNQEPIIVAQRGRAYRGEPQHLEARKDNLTNTITSVAKDNYVAESGGAIIEDFYKSRPARVYKDTAPTLRADRQGLKVVDGISEDKDNQS